MLSHQMRHRHLIGLGSIFQGSCALPQEVTLLLLCMSGTFRGHGPKLPLTNTFHATILHGHLRSASACSTLAVGPGMEQRLSPRMRAWSWPLTSAKRH